MAAQKASATKLKKKPAPKRAVALDRKAKKSPPAKPAAPAAKVAPKAAPVKAAPIAAAKKPVVAMAKADLKIPKSPLSKSELGHFRDLLLEKRREILGDVGTMESEAFKAGSNLSNMPIHMADVGTDNFEQEFTLGLIESERKILREIQEALVRIDEGGYGLCLGTGKPIPKSRLEAVPWTKYSLDYAKALESGQLRHEGAGGRDEDSGDEDAE